MLNLLTWFLVTSYLALFGVLVTKKVTVKVIFWKKIRTIFHYWLLYYSIHHQISYPLQRADIFKVKIIWAEILRNCIIPRTGMNEVKPINKKLFFSLELTFGQRKPCWNGGKSGLNKTFCRIVQCLTRLFSFTTTWSKNLQVCCQNIKLCPFHTKFLHVVS